MTKDRHILLLFIVFLVLFSAIHITMLTNEVSYFGEDGYMLLHNAQLFSEQKQFLVYDSLSFLGREKILNPVMYAFLKDIFLNPYYEILIKIVLYISALSTLLIVFGLTSFVTDKMLYRVMSVVIASSMPVFVLRYAIEFSYLTILIPLQFLAIYLYLLWQKEKTGTKLIFLYIIFFINILLDVSFLFVLLGVLFYFLLLRLEKVRIKYKILQLLLPIFLFAFLWNYILYYKFFLVYGASSLFYQFTVSSYAHFVSFIFILPFLGLLVFCASLYGIFHHFSQKKIRIQYLLIALVFVYILFLFIGFVSYDSVLLYTSISLVSLLPLFFNKIEKNLSTSVFAHHQTSIVLFLCIVLLFSTCTPLFFLYNQYSATAPITSEVVDGLIWIKTHTPQNAVLVVPQELSYTAMYFSNRQTIADKDTVLVPYASYQSNILHEIYNALFVSNVLESLDELHVEKEAVYVLQSDSFLQFLPGNKAQFLSDDCFYPVYNTTATTVYKKTCELIKK